MTPHITIRPETPADVHAITAVTIEAFRSLEVSDQTEHLIVRALREAGALTLSLVADRDREVIGHIAFSPVTFSDRTPGWEGLAPVSVHPAHQRQGIGSALVREGLARIRAAGARGCCLVGHPEYYGRFGFLHPSGLGMDGVPPEALFALAFEGPMPTGTIAFHPAFNLGQ